MSVAASTSDATATTMAVMVLSFCVVFLCFALLFLFYARQKREEQRRKKQLWTAYKHGAPRATPSVRTFHGRDGFVPAASFDSTSSVRPLSSALGPRQQIVAIPAIPVQSPHSGQLPPGHRVSMGSDVLRSALVEHEEKQSVIELSEDHIALPLPPGPPRDWRMAMASPNVHHDRCSGASWTHLATDVPLTAFGSPSVTMPAAGQRLHLYPPSMPMEPVPEQVAPQIVPMAAMDHLDLAFVQRDHAAETVDGRMSRLSEVTPSLPAAFTMDDDEEDAVESSTSDSEDEDDEATSLKPQNTARGGRKKITFPARRVSGDERAKYTFLDPQNIQL